MTGGLYQGDEKVGNADQASLFRARKTSFVIKMRLKGKVNNL